MTEQHPASGKFVPASGGPALRQAAAPRETANAAYSAAEAARVMAEMHAPVSAHMQAMALPSGPDASSQHTG